MPAAHPYVQHLSALGAADGVVRLDDVPVSGAPSGQWWPPAMLEGSWVRSHADDFDLFHVHFGFEGRTTDELGGMIRALREIGRPLVVTVHDLRNPHLYDQRAHTAALDILVRAAAAIVTLTPGAAAEIQARWGRRAEIIAHPHLVDLDRMDRPRPAHDGFVVGLHAKSERVNNESVAVATAVAAAVAAIPGGRLSFRAHDDDRGRAVAAAVHELGCGPIDVHVHGRLSDHDLWDWVSTLDVSVLPYRFGTHSGWLEMCNDLGTAVLAPSCGFYAQQGPCLPFIHDESGLDTASLAAALHRAYRERPGWRWTPEGRRVQRAGIARAHLEVYLRALGRRQ